MIGYATESVTEVSIGQMGSIAALPRSQTAGSNMTSPYQLSNYQALVASRVKDSLRQDLQLLMLSCLSTRRPVALFLSH